MSKNITRLPTNRVTHEDIDEVEDAVRELVSNDVVTRRLPPLPEYVKHAPDIDDVGRLTSEALIMSYEASASRLEEMGKTLTEEMKHCQRQTQAMVQECERVVKETEDVVAQCKSAAEVYRAQAKEMFEQIQRRALVADKVRKTCATMLDEIKAS